MDNELTRLLRRSVVSALAEVPTIYDENREYAICRLFASCDLNPEYGLVVYDDLSGTRHCTSFFINAPALPKSAKISEVLEFFFDEIYSAKGFTLVTWSNQLTLHTSLWGVGYALVGPCIVAEFDTSQTTDTHVTQVRPTVDVSVRINALIANGVRNQQFHSLPMRLGASDQFDVVVTTIPENEQHKGVFLLEENGLDHAKRYLNTNAPDHIVQVLYYPSNTRIITSFYLDGLFKEAFLNCPSAVVFLRKYKLANLNNADSLLREWALQTKKWKK